MVIARAGIRDAARASARSSACCSSRWVPFLVRAVQIYVAANFPQARASRADRRDVPAVPRAAGLLRLLRHGLRRRRPDRQRPPRQRAADLSVEAADARRVHRRQARDPARRSCCSSPGCRRCCCCSCRCCSPAASRSSGTTCSCSRRSPSSRFVQVLAGRRSTMLALSSLSKSSRYVGILYAGVIFFTAGDLRRAAARSPAARGCRGCRSPANLTQVGDAIFRLPPRYDDAVAGVAARASSALIARVDLGARAARARRRGGRVSDADRHRRAPVEVVRPGHRPERRHRRPCRRASPGCSARTAPASRRS